MCSGELYPVETDVRLCDELTTGEEVEVDMENDMLTVLASGKKYNLKPLGDVSDIGSVTVKELLHMLASQLRSQAHKSHRF